MGLADELDKEVCQPRTPCKTCDFYNTLDEADRRAFDDWVAADKPVAALRRACQRQGLDISESSFMRHVKKQCSGTR